MKLEANSTVENILMGDLTETNFGILANEKMFSILSSKIYADKIKAPIRELCSNAFDAHVAAGKKLLPFQVHIPTHEELFFAVEDSGPGMDSREIEELYTTYGFSSKAASNRFIGCLGLGSKSPFAYTDNFQIVSRKNGIEYHYQCLIESGIPRLIKFDEHPCDKPSGLAVRFHILREDVWRFRNAVASVCRHFAPRPSFNQEPEMPAPLEFDCGIARDDEFCGHAVLMGNVLYPYSIVDFKQNEKLTEFVERFRRFHSILKAEIGEVDVAVSRETVELTDKTVSFIVRKYQEYSRKVLENFKAKAYGIPSKYEYLREYGQFLRGKSHICRNDFDRERAAFQLSFEGEADYLIIYRQNFRKTPERARRKFEGEVRFEDRYYLSNVRWIYSEKQLSSSEGINSFVQHGSGNQAIIFNNENLLKALEADHITVYRKKDFLNSTAQQAKQDRTRDLDGYTRITARSSCDASRLNYGMQLSPFSARDMEELEKAGKIYYVRTKFRKPMESEFDRLRKDLKPGFFSSFHRTLDGITVGMNDERFSAVRSDSRYINLIDHVNAFFDVKSESYRKARVSSIHRALNQNYALLLYIDLEKQNIPEQFHDLLEAAREVPPEQLPPEFNLYRECLALKANEEERLREFRDFLNERYPMLSYVYYGHNSYWKVRGKEELSFIQEYIKLIDHKKESEK